MTKQDIVEDIALRTGLTKKEVAEAVELFLKSVGTALAEVTPDMRARAKTINFAR